MSSNTTYPAGYTPITTASFAQGAGNPRDSAMMSLQQMNAKQNDINRTASGGGRRRKYRGGASDQVAVPQFQMQYTPTGGVGTNPNDQIKAGSSTSMQSAAWAVNDNQATKVGGRKSCKGGAGDWSWGCYSGGKKTKRRHSRKSRKHHKRTKSRRHHRRH